MLVLFCLKILQRKEKVSNPSAILRVTHVLVSYVVFHPVTDLHLASLNLLFDKHALNAASIVDSDGVLCFVGEDTGRRVYQVKGGKGHTVYTVFPEHYCSCHAFFYDIVSKSEGVYVCVFG